MASHIKTELIVGERSGISLQIPPPPIPKPLSKTNKIVLRSLKSGRYTFSFRDLGRQPFPPPFTHTLLTLKLHVNQKDGGRGQERKWTLVCPKEGLHTFRATECSDAETPAGHPRGRTNCRSPSYLSSQWLQADPACCTAKSAPHHHTQPCTEI